MHSHMIQICPTHVRKHCIVYTRSISIPQAKPVSLIQFVLMKHKRDFNEALYFDTKKPFSGIEIGFSSKKETIL